MTMFIDGNNDKILFENIDLFGPASHAFVAFLRRTQIHIILHRMKFIFRPRRSRGESFVEISGENVSFAAALFGYDSILDPFEVKINNNVVQERLVFQAEIIFGTHGHGIRSGYRILAIFF